MDYFVKPSKQRKGFQHLFAESPQKNDQQDPSMADNKKLPLGTTHHYIVELNKSPDLDLSVIEDLRKNYSRLTTTDDTRKQLIIALVKAAGAVKTEGWIWRTERILPGGIQSLKLLEELLLIGKRILRELSRYIL